MKIYVLQYANHSLSKMNHLRVCTDYNAALEAAVGIARVHFESEGSHYKGDNRSMIYHLDHLYNTSYQNQFDEICKWTESLDTKDCDDYLEMAINTFDVDV